MNLGIQVKEKMSLTWGTLQIILPIFWANSKVFWVLEERKIVCTKSMSARKMNLFQVCRVRIKNKNNTGHFR